MPAAKSAGKSGAKRPGRLVAVLDYTSPTAHASCFYCVARPALLLHFDCGSFILQRPVCLDCAKEYEGIKPPKRKAPTVPVPQS